MRIIDCVQGEPDWWAARLGLPTASEFNKIITPAKLEPSQQAYTYRNKLLGEILRDKPDDSFVSEWMSRGHEYEHEAVEAYAFMRDVKPEPIGFCTTDDGRYGCSPDRKLGDKAGLEVKCPSPGVHVGYLLDGKLPTAYRVQVLGQLLVTGWEYIDFMSYHPDMESLVIRVRADENQEALERIATALDTFCKNLDQCKALLTKKGYLEAA